MMVPDIKALDGKLRSDRRNMIAFIKERRKLPFGARLLQSRNKRRKIMSKKPVVLMILDGYGLNKTHEGNAVYEAKKPVMDRLMKECPFVEGQASGLAVGLPEGQMGNSEVGHLNMGAGRIVYQELTRIYKVYPGRRFL